MPGAATTVARGGQDAAAPAGAPVPTHVVDALRFAIDQDFLVWAALPGTAALLADLLADAKAGRAIDVAAAAARAVAQATAPAGAEAAAKTPWGLPTGGGHGTDAGSPPPAVPGGMPPHSHPHGGMASALSPAGPLMPSSPRARFSVAGGPAGGSPSAAGGVPLFPGGAPPSPTLAGAAGPAVWHSHSAAVSLLGGGAGGGGGHDESELTSLDGGKGVGVQSPPAGALASVPLSPKLPVSPSRTLNLARSPPVSPKFVSSGTSAFGLGLAGADEGYPVTSSVAGSPRSPSARRSYAAVAAAGGFGSTDSEDAAGAVLSGGSAGHSPLSATNIGIALSPPLLGPAAPAASGGLDTVTGVASPLPPQSPRSSGLRAALSPSHAGSSHRPASPPSSVVSGAGGLEAFPLAAPRPLSPASDTGSEGILVHASGDDSPSASAAVSPDDSSEGKAGDDDDDDAVSLATASDGEGVTAGRRGGPAKDSSVGVPQGAFDASALSLDLEGAPSDGEASGGAAAAGQQKATKRALEAELAAVEDKTASDSKEAKGEDDAAATPAPTAAAAPAGTAPPASGGSLQSTTAAIPRFFTKRTDGSMRTRGRALAGDALSERLPAILELFRRHGLYAAAPEAVSGGCPAGAANAPPAKAAPPQPSVAVFPSAQAAAAARAAAGTQALGSGPAAAREAEALVAAHGGVLAPSRAMVALEGVEVAWEDAHLALPVEQFAAVAKTLCGFPSFFAAPLFRRVRQQFLGATNNHGLPRLPEHALAASAPVEVDAAACNAGANPKPRSRVVPLSLAENPVTPGEAQQRDTNGLIPLPAFLTFWRREIEPYDHVDRFFRLVRRRDRDAIEPADFMPLMEELLAFHPGLAFLEATPEFQEKYARTVIARIFYNWDPTARRALDARSLRRSDLLAAFHTVDVEEDINLVTAYFSYEHFYVLYCKFWELDTDRDFLLSRADLNRLSELTRVVLDRVFTQAGRPFTSGHPDKMGYEDFVVFYMSEQDKTSEASLRYWFGVCDVDGDGYLSPEDLKHFYSEQEQRMRDWGMEVVAFPDVLCQMTDLLKPKISGRIHLSDFMHPERCKLTGVLFSALFNLTKFQAFEGRDAQYVKQEVNITGPSQWDKFAQIEYSRLASEEEMQAD